MSMTASELRSLTDRLPREPLCHLPTPLHACPRFSEALGGEVNVYLKRDDLTGMGCGGNKLRKLEFSLGEVRQGGYDAIVHGLAGQSNYCRQTAAVAARIGLPCHLVLRKDHKWEDPAQGNRLLDYVLGAQVTMVEPGEQKTAKAELVERLKSEGHRPYLVGYRDEVLGAVGYTLCMAETLEQAETAGFRPDVVCVTGRSGTLAGLILGKRLLGWNGQVLGFQPAPAADDEALRAGTVPIVNDAAELLGVDETFALEDVNNTSAYGGAKYGTPTEECLEAMALLGSTEGLLVGPVYTAKGLSGVIDYIRTGRIPAGSSVVFVHTGGTPETFPYNAEIADYLASGG